MVRVARAGAECHVKKIVPVTRAMRVVVIMRTYGKVRSAHTGVTKMIRSSSVVRAGLVVADVAVRCVERKSVSSRRGSSRMLHRVVNSLRVSTISSNVFWCLRFVASEGSLLWPFLIFSFSLVILDDDSGEYRRLYIPRINPTTTTTGPAHRMTTSPYSITPQ
jgi:hypothetical protein